MERQPHHKVRIVDDEAAVTLFIAIMRQAHMDATGRAVCSAAEREEAARFINALRDDSGASTEV